jgi:Rieske Fe-S protein
MSISRRVFLKQSAAGAAVLTLPACSNGVDAPPIVDAEVEDDPTEPAAYGTVQLSLARVGDLAAVGGAVTLHLAPLVRNDPMRPFKLPDPPRVLVFHRAAQMGEDEFVAVDSACPHLGCPLGYVPSLDQIGCPCHQSKFRATVDPADVKSCVGQVLHKPAQKDLTVYTARRDPQSPTTLIIDLKEITACGDVRLPPVVGGKVTLPIGQYPQLAQVGGSVIGRPMGAPDPIAIVRVAASSDASAFSAVSGVCTHLKCTVSHSSAGTDACGDVPGGGFFCACHCSKFAIDGAVLNGPATAPLQRYTLTFDGTTLVISL